VRIEHQLSRDGKQLVAPKKPRSRRTVPLPTVVAEALAEHVRNFPHVEGYLFSTSRSNPYNHLEYSRRVFAPAVERADLGNGSPLMICATITPRC
jgi:integrase